ncbi:AAA family ATPase [Candidatus Micrarchaeota archaeon]|nr:AAA family ATPase [Candidatus Micrarchaeota archaeon]
MQQKQSETQSVARAQIAFAINAATHNQQLFASLVVFLGALALIGTTHFFPTYLTVAFALACGIIAYKAPHIGTLLGVIISLFGVMYQSPVLTWPYLLLVALTFFTFVESWLTIATLEILIASPFAVSLPYQGWLTILGMSLAALYFGSKKSLQVSLGSVFAILLLSAIWNVQNTAYLPINLSNYQPPKETILFQKGPVQIGEILSQIVNSITQFISPANLGQVWDSPAQIINTTYKLLVFDSLGLQLVGWGIALFLLSYLPSKLEKRQIAISSLALLILIPVYLGVQTIYGTAIKVELYEGLLFSILCLWIADLLNISISKESQIQRTEKMKAYGKFGMTDMSSGDSEKSLGEIGGYEDVKTELKDAILLPIKHKELAYAYGMKPPSGILLFGPPGTGKTMMMRGLAKELGFNFIEVRCSQILSQWVGESEKNVAEIFTSARKSAPTVLFFDEIDSLARKRGVDALDRVGSNVLTTLLQEIDGATKSNKTVIVIGATNIPGELDPAILRPGRFDKIIYMPLPDKEAREQIFKVHLKKIPTTQDIDIPTLVKKTERFSGADIKNIITEAKERAAKEAFKTNKIVPVSMTHIIEIIAGLKPSTSLAQIDMYQEFRLDFERRSGKPSDKEKEEKTEVVRWGEVIGLDQIKQSLLEAIEIPLLHEQEMKEMNLKPSKGILLFGPPGTGKTLIVKAAATELKASFQTMSSAELMKKGYTQAVTIIKETFNRARENTPALIFLDEIETFAPTRGSGMSSEILGQFLTEMDGVKGLKGVVVIGATNKPALLDSAILRPGRFDKIFYVPPPDTKGRADMFRLNLGKFAETLDVLELSRLSEGFSGADIAAICQSAKMNALKEKIAGREAIVAQPVIRDQVRKRKPSITSDMLMEYQKFIDEYGERN